MSQFNVHEWNRKRRLSENEENINEATIFDKIDADEALIIANVDGTKAFKALVAEFQAISGGTQVLARALRRLKDDFGLGG